MTSHSARGLLSRQARIRPTLKADVFSNADRVTKDGKKVAIGPGERDAFDFDYVYGTDAKHEHIVERDVDRWLKTVLQGYHGAIMVMGEVRLVLSYYK